jgi:hypothetical protein
MILWYGVKYKTTILYNMPLNASSLKSNETQKIAFRKEINSIIGYIDSELKTAHEQGKHKVTLNLPTIFSIPYLTNAESQRIIFSKVIISLKDRGFNVEFEINQDVAIFYITWLSNDDLKEIELQNALLAKHTKKK